MKRFLLYIILTIFGLIVIFPFLWMLYTSFKPEHKALSLTISFRDFTIENFVKIIRNYSFGRYFLNSLIVSTLSGFFATLFAALAAYPLARKSFFLKRELTFLFLSSMMIPGLMYMIPQYVIVSKLGWINTYKGLIIPHLANVFGMFLLMQYYKTLPDAIFEAAQIDGASDLRIFLRIVIPLSLPVLLTCFLLTFQFHWNNFLWQLIVTTDEKMYTVPVGLAMFRSAHEEMFALKMAASTLSIIPISILFIVAQRYFIEGITSGAVKG
uniref:Carbohydrate ABC transporter permease n=1 Tax=candidate division WOR-3 bacterium TaxID=2052148 RepID=A0A7C4UBJ3_UNCW3